MGTESRGGTARHHPGTSAPRTSPILTPDQRIRVFVSSTLQELAPERAAARAAIAGLHFTPVLFELGARPHPPRALYRSYLEQSDVFVGVYWRQYGWVAPGTEVSGLEDEYLLAGSLPKLVYMKEAEGEREPGLHALLERIASDHVSYRQFGTPAELSELLAEDLALLVSERFAGAPVRGGRRVAIPTPVSSFVGREREVDEVVELLRRSGLRLLTLVGTGGIGKTRLALEAARRASNDFRDGVVFVSLTSVSDSDGVLPAIAEALGVTVRPETGPAESLKAQLAERELLLVLDNMEHLLGAGPPVAELLAAAPGLSVLVTSRARLDLSGEHLFLVPPLSMPEPGESTIADIERSDAVRLFTARARAAGWITCAADAPIVVEIVRRLDGLPLAIELAAAQARLVPAELVHSRLRRRLDIAGGPRDADERHRTLRSTIDWSYELLDEPARRFFETLSVCVGGFSLEAAAALVEPGEDAEGLLASLVDASLVTAGPSPAWGVRLGMLETLREYAGERLDDREACPEAAARHMAYFRGLAEEVYDATPFDPMLRSRLDEERENLRAAIVEATATDPAEAVRLAGALGSFYSRRGLSREGRDVLARALEAAPDAPAGWRARALLQLGWVAAELDDTDEADRVLGEALALYRALGDERGIGTSLNSLGFSASTREDMDRARRFFEDAYEIFGEAEYEALRLYPAVNLAAILVADGELDEARRLYGEALAYFEPAGLEDEVATVRYRLGEVEETDGDLGAARRWFEESAEGARRVGNHHLLAWALMRLGNVDSQAGRTVEAHASLSEALELHLELGQPSGAAYTLEYAARAAVREARSDEAARLLGAARARRDSSGVPVSEYELPRLVAAEAELRARLGDDEFDRAAAAGAALDASGLLALVDETLAPAEGSV